MKLIVQGLGRMGMQIARKLAEASHTIIALNRSPEPIEHAKTYGCIGSNSIADAISHFNNDEQIIVWIMLPHDIAEIAAKEWAKVLPQGSIIINGANSDYRKIKALNRSVQGTGIDLIDVGVSGGVWGYANGFPLMVGADDRNAVTAIEPILESLSKPGGAWGYFGKSGAGNYVKMVHNAIEYGMMQSLAEGYQLLHDGPYENMDIALAGSVWQHHSVISSWLNELTRQAVSENPDMDGVSGAVSESGETRWALETAGSLGFDLPAIQTAFDVRIKSQQGSTNYATKLVAAQRNKFGGHDLNGQGVAR